MFKKIILQLVAASLLLFSFAAHADDLTLKNGDKLSGRLVMIENQNLYFQTDYAGELVIPAGQVSEIKTSNPVRVDLGSGEVLVGTIETNKQKRIRLVTANTLYYFNPYEVITLRAMTDEEAKSFGHFVKPNVWDHQVEIGAQVRTGNTSAQDGSLGYASTMTNDVVLLTNSLNAAYGRANGTRATQQVLGQSRLDWSHTPRFYSFYLLDGEHDYMRDLSLRAREEAGVGYRLIKSAKSLLQTDVGLGLSEEILRNASDDVNPLGHLGALFKQKIGQASEFGLQSVFLPEFSDLGEFLSESEAWILTPITRSFLLRLSALDRYDSSPAPTIKKNDVTFRTSLVIVF